jgi:hypothetical protein
LGYEGVQLGSNSATAGPSLTPPPSHLPSIVLGYNIMHNNMLVGVEGLPIT